MGLKSIQHLSTGLCQDFDAEQGTLEMVANALFHRDEFDIEFCRHMGYLVISPKENPQNSYRVTVTIQGT